MEDIGISVNVHIGPSTQFGAVVRESEADPYAVLDIESGTEHYNTISLIIRYPELIQLTQTALRTIEQLHRLNT